MLPPFQVWTCPSALQFLTLCQRPTPTANDPDCLGQGSCRIEYIVVSSSNVNISCQLNLLIWERWLSQVIFDLTTLRGEYLLVEILDEFLFRRAHTLKFHSLLVNDGSLRLNGNGILGCICSLSMIFISWLASFFILYTLDWSLIIWSSW